MKNKNEQAHEPFRASPHMLYEPLTRTLETWMVPCGISVHMYKDLIYNFGPRDGAGLLINNAGCQTVLEVVHSLGS